MDSRRSLRLALAGALLALLCAGCEELDRELIMVKPRLDIDLELAEDFARVFNEPGQIRISLVDNPNPDLPGQRALTDGVADLALVPNTASYDPALATVVPLYPTVLHIVYRLVESDEPGAELMERLTRGTVFAGPPGSPSRELLETAAKRVGIDPQAINYINDTVACADVVILYAPILPNNTSSIGRCGKYRLYSLGSPGDIGAGSVIDSMTLFNPHLKPFVIPADTYGDLTPEPVVTLAVDKLLVVRKEVPESLIYDLLREVMRLKPALSASRPGLFHELTDDFDISGSTFVLHPGALAYLQRDEPDIYERYSGVAEVVVTLMIGLISGIYAIFRIITIRRKNRIDAFCREALEIRDAAQEKGDEAAVREAIDALQALRDRAYGEMINERLTADESFRIFVTLTHDIVADLRGEGRQRGA